MGFRKSLDCEHSIIMEEPGMNGIILYQSKYGATKKYAQWLSEKTGFPCVETKQAIEICGGEYEIQRNAYCC